jgi:hypothetical protein
MKPIFISCSPSQVPLHRGAGAISVLRLVHFVKAALPAIKY